MNKDNKKISLSAILLLLISCAAAVIVWLLAKYNIISVGAEAAFAAYPSHLLFRL